MNKPCIHIAIPHFIGDKGFIVSQILKPFGANLSSGYAVTLWSFSIDPQVDRNFASAAQEYGIRCKFVPIFLFKGLSYLGFFLRLWSEVRGAGDSVMFLYSRELYGGIINLLIKRLTLRVRVVYDFRAVQVDEVEFAYSGFKRALVQKVWRFYESVVSRFSDRLNCVTDELKEYVEERYPVKVDTVIPCCIDPRDTVFTSDWRTARLQLGFSPDDVVIAYSGGIDAWQCFQETAQLVSELGKVDSRVRFLVVTPQPEKAGSILATMDLEATVITAKQHEVREILRCADIGLLLRKPHVVNRVAFPIKFAEYLASGLPVITTAALPAIYRVVRELRVGAIVDLDTTDLDALAGFVSEYTLLRGEFKERCVNAAGSRFTWNCFSESHLSLFSGGAL